MVVQLLVVPNELKGTKVTPPVELVTDNVDLMPVKALAVVKQRSNDARLTRFAELLLIVFQSLKAVPF